jgi:ABC-type transport system involved in multi-copper enzyme maturation permease subunit
MTDSLITLWLTATVLCLVQFLAALPWLAVLDRQTFRAAVRKPTAWATAAGSVLGAGVLLALLILMVQERERLALWGRVFAAVLHLQLIADFFVVVFAVLLKVWPRGGAVALAAFREGVRQPLYWFILIIAATIMLVSIFLPYYTFGDDFKMMKHIGFDLAMLASGTFAVIAAALSISEEIEGRTAITLMSKPVSRRQFLLGKYGGILLAALSLSALLGWCLLWALYFMPFLLWMPDLSDPLQSQILPWVTSTAQQVAPSGEMGAIVSGAALWIADALTILPGLVIGFCQVMLLVAVAASLATRLPMVVTLVGCLVVFFLGNLAPVLVQVSRNAQQAFQHNHQGQTSGALDLVQFMARLFDTVLPALEYFNMAPAIARDKPLPLGDYCWYVGSVGLYAIMYTAIALLLGLILFEDRDLA